MHGRLRAARYADVGCPGMMAAARRALFASVVLFLCVPREGVLLLASGWGERVLCWCVGFPCTGGQMQRVIVFGFPYTITSWLSSQVVVCLLDLLHALLVGFGVRGEGKGAFVLP
eukprot:1134734-Pelagomonas_calceolata.AAC.3